MGAYIDRDELLELYANTDELDISNYDVKIAVIRQNILDMPTVDIVPCKECKHRDPEDKKCDCGMFERQGCIFPVADDYFCKYGERRSE